MNRLFLDEIEPRDQTYCFIRDHPDGAEAKVFVERLWNFYFPYADAIQKNNTQRRVTREMLAQWRKGGG